MNACCNNEIGRIPDDPHIIIDRSLLRVPTAEIKPQLILKALPTRFGYCQVSEHKLASLMEYSRRWIPELVGNLERGTDAAGIGQKIEKRHRRTGHAVPTFQTKVGTKGGYKKTRGTFND